MDFFLAAWPKSNQFCQADSVSDFQGNALKNRRMEGKTLTGKTLTAFNVIINSNVFVSLLLTMV